VTSSSDKRWPFDYPKCFEFFAEFGICDLYSKALGWRNRHPR
jgi:hypothetical protein